MKISLSILFALVDAGSFFQKTTHGLSSYIYGPLKKLTAIPFRNFYLQSAAWSNWKSEI